mgnify:CR=1 FL=1
MTQEFANNKSNILVYENLPDKFCYDNNITTLFYYSDNMPEKMFRTESDLLDYFSLVEMIVFI